jgi:hypothetical protein
MLLCFTALAVKPDDPAWFHIQVGDNETDVGGTILQDATRPWRQHGEACPRTPPDTRSRRRYASRLWAEDLKGA